MSIVLKFPDFDVRTWRSIEDSFRSRFLSEGAEPELIDYLIARLRRLYERFGNQEGCGRVCMDLLEEILVLEIRLWYAGVPAPVKPGPINKLHVVLDS